MKMTRTRILGILLAFVLLLGMMPPAQRAYAADGELRFTTQPVSGTAPMNSTYRFTWALNASPDTLILQGYTTTHRWANPYEIKGLSYYLLPYNATYTKYRIKATKGDTILYSDEFTVTWTENIYTVTAWSNGHGYSSADPTSGPEGTVVTLTSTPISGYRFGRWEIVSGSCGEGDEVPNATSPTTSFTIGTSNVTVKAIFENTVPDPVIISTSNVSGGTKVTWSAVEGASHYSLGWYDEVADESDAIDGITGTSYTVPKNRLKSGTRYRFYVHAKVDGNYSNGNNGKVQTYMEAPVITKTRNVNAGIEVTWDAVGGATSYILMYKTDGGSWSTYKSGIETTKFVVPKADLKSGTKYWFTVKSKGAATSGYTSGKAQTYMATPAVTKTRNVNAGVEVTWSKVTGATSYILMYKKDGGSWATYKSGITATKFVVPKADLKSGTKYWFTVKAKGAATSGYSSGKAQTYMTTPTVKSATQTSTGVKVTWGEVTGAKTYTVMMKVSGGSWTTVMSGVTGTSYTVPKSKLTSGKTYSFTVKAVGAATSGYSSGVSLTYRA